MNAALGTRLARLEARQSPRPFHIVQAVVRQDHDEQADARRQFDGQRLALLASGTAQPGDEIHELTICIVPSPHRRAP